MSLSFCPSFSQIINRVQVEHFLPTEWRTVNSPRIRNDGCYDCKEKNYGSFNPFFHSRAEFVIKIWITKVNSNKKSNKFSNQFLRRSKESNPFHFWVTLLVIDRLPVAIIVTFQKTTVVLLLHYLYNILVVSYNVDSGFKVSNRDIVAVYFLE